MESPTIIEHQGIVSRIEGNRITVAFIAQSACGACNAKNFCQVAEQKEKEVQVTDSTGRFQVGETVNLVMHQSMGTRAVFLAYVVPFILMILSLICTNAIAHNEIVSAFIALGVLALYYIILSFFKHYIAKSFSFHIEKL